MKKYTHEFFNQILSKLTNIGDSIINSSRFYNYGEYIEVVVTDNDIWYSLKSPKDYYGVTTDIFELRITKNNKSIKEPELLVQYILKDKNLIQVQILMISKEFKESHSKYNIFYYPFPNKIVVEYEKSKVEKNRKVGLYVWWSFGRGDGDGRYSEMEVNDKQYRLLAEYNNEEIGEINEPSLDKLLSKVYKREIKSLKEDSKEFWDPSEEGESFKDYWNNLSVGVRIKHGFEDDI